MTEDEVLAGAMEVFNKSVQTGTQTTNTQGQQDQPSVLDRTASGTQQSTDQANPSNNQAGSDGDGQISAAGTAGTDQTVQNGSSTGEPGTEGTEQVSGGGSETGDLTTAGADGGTGQTTAGENNSTGTYPQTTYSQGGINYDSSGRKVIIIGTGSGVLTDQERVGTLNRELEEQMGVFDGMILGRRQDVIAKTNEEGAGQIVTSGTGTGDQTGNTPPLLTASRDPNNMQTPGQLPDAPSDNRQGDYQNRTGGNDNIPADISDGSDDDIVARQLREAAMQEQDPVLREKLWDEYRKYKEGVQARR